MISERFFDIIWLFLPITTLSECSTLLRHDGWKFIFLLIGAKIVDGLLKLEFESLFVPDEQASVSKFCTVKTDVLNTKTVSRDPIWPPDNQGFGVKSSLGLEKEVLIS